MFCSNCGTKCTAEDSSFCTNCGASLLNNKASQAKPSIQPAFSTPVSSPSLTFQDNSSNSYIRESVPSSAQFNPPPQKKSKKGLIIGLSVAGVVLVAGIVVLILFLTGVFGGSSGSNKFAGRWNFDSVEVYGMTIDADTFNSLADSGMITNSENVATSYIEIDDNAMVTLNLMGEVIVVQGEIDGNNLKLSQGNTVMNCHIENNKLVFVTDSDDIMGKVYFKK